MEQLPAIVLIGHTEYSLKVRSNDRSRSFGEINNGQKLHSLLVKRGFDVAGVLDIYELFGIESMNDSHGELLVSMAKSNAVLAEHDLEIITDYDNAAAAAFRKNLASRLKKGKEYVLLFLTWPRESLAAFSTGVHLSYPVIIKDDSFIRGPYQAKFFPIKKLAEQAHFVIGESLLSGFNCLEFGLPKDRFMVVPNLVPDIRCTPPQKTASDQLLIGCPARCVRRKNVEIAIEAASDAYREHPHFKLLLKGPLDSEFDDFTQYTEKLHMLLKGAQKEPWFDWDPSFTPYPQILDHYSQYDLAVFPSGAEIGCNTVAEVASLGVPLILTDATVNPYLYKGMGVFIPAGEPVEAPWPYPQPDPKAFKEALVQLACSEEKRRELGLQAKERAFSRFGQEEVAKRVPLIVQAAYENFHGQAALRESIENQFNKDIDAFEISRELLPA